MYRLCAFWQKKPKFKWLKFSFGTRCRLEIMLHLRSLGYLRQPFSRVTPGPATFSLISLQNSADRLQEIVNSSRVGETTWGGESSHLGRQGSPGRWGSFFSYKHLVWPTRDEATGIENACARHYQDVYNNFFLSSAILSNVKFHINVL